MVEKAGMITEAIFRYIHFKKAISLCNVPINITSGFAHMLNKNEKNVTMEIQGINHFIIATDVFVNSKAKFNEIINIYAHLNVKDTIQMKTLYHSHIHHHLSKDCK